MPGGGGALLGPDEAEPAVVPTWLLLWELCYATRSAERCLQAHATNPPGHKDPGAPLRLFSSSVVTNVAPFWVICVRRDVFSRADPTCSGGQAPPPRGRTPLTASGRRSELVMNVQIVKNAP